MSCECVTTMPVSTNTLFKIAGVGGVLSFGGAAYLRYRIQQKFIAEGFYEESVRILTNYPVGVELLGKPIRCMKMDLGDRPNNYTDGYQAKVTIPVKGIKASGRLQCWCSRNTSENKWYADKCDLEVLGKSWTFYINPTAPKSYSPSGLSPRDAWDDHAEA